MLNIETKWYNLLIGNSFIPLKKLTNYDSSFNQWIISVAENKLGKNYHKEPLYSLNSLISQQKKDSLLAIASKGNDLSIRVMERQFLKNIRQWFSLPEEDQLLEDKVTLSDHEHQIIYIRNSKINGRLALVVPGLYAEISENNTSIRHQLENDTTARFRVNISNTHSSGNTEEKPFLNTTDDFRNAISSLLATLAFSLPAPWGPVVSAGISFLNFLLGKNNHSSISLVEAQAKILSTILRNESQVANIYHITDFTQVYSQYIETISLQPHNVEYMQEYIIPTLKNMSDPNFSASLINTISNNMDNKYYLVKNEKDSIGIASLKALTLAMILHTSIKKMLLNFYSLMASNAHSCDKKAFMKNTQLWYGVWVDLSIMVQGHGELKGYIDRLLNIREEVHTQRISSISGIKRTVIGNGQKFSFADNWKDKTISSIYKPSPNPSTNYEKEMAAFEKKFTDQRNSYIAEHEQSFNSDFTKLCIDFDTTIKSIQDYFMQWKNGIIPEKPENTIKIDFSESATPTPHGKWQDGKVVKYRLSYRNTAGQSTSEWRKKTVDGKACPVLRNIPVDPLSMAFVRIIERCFEGEQESHNIIIDDNVSTEVVDNG